MTKNLDNEGLRSLINNYDLFFIDLWGVVHNGVQLYEKAINVLDEISKAKKDYILLTNAPRPNNTVKLFLEKMGMDKRVREKVFTSGEAALSFLKKEYSNNFFFHIGPPRDFDLFKNFENKKTENIKESDYFLCTGLFEYEDDLKFYKELLSDYTSRKMICTNPDLIVDRGDKREFCAGSVALTFEKLGGKVVYFGKPYPEVYRQSAILEGKKILAIGDNLNTDIKGANLLNYDSPIISNGIHKNEIKEKGIEATAKSYETICNYIQSELKW